MSEPEATPPSGPGERLERALQIWLQQPVSTAAEAEALLAQHPDLRDVLEPMLAQQDAAPAAAPADGDERTIGEYRLLRELGRGGMGTVHEAWQSSLDRRVAVKLLAPGLVSSPSAVARFRREAAAVGRLRHPNIVEVYGFGADGAHSWFAMQLIDGEPLHHCAARFRQPAAALALLVQLASALEHAHAHGIVHRDVKPANVLVRADDSAVLTDFGVASDDALPSLTREGSFLGTLAYAPPEQVRGERVDARADLWALGVILHELLTGRHPFADATQEATMRNILTAEPPSLRRVPGIAPDLAAVAGRLLEKSPARRYANATALLADLRALQAGAPVTARLATPTERALRWARREPWRATALATLLTGLAAAGTGFVLASRRADDNERLAQAESAARIELAAKVHDYDLLAGMTLYDRAVQRERTLFPARPALLDALQAWLHDDCAPLQTLQPQVQQAITALRAQALPRSDAERERERRAHPDFAAWQTAANQLASLEHAAALRAGAPLVEPPVPAAQAGLDATVLNVLAWERVAPKPDERKVWNEEPLGLAYARLAAQKTTGTPLASNQLDTLAWALLANGQDAAAAAASEQAVAMAGSGERANYTNLQRDLQRGIAGTAAAHAALTDKTRALDERISMQRAFRFADDKQQFLHDTLLDLRDKLDGLFALQLPRVQQRIVWAQRVHDLTLHHPHARVSWADARAAIAAADGVTAHAAYRGKAIPLDDDTVLGLVPIGMNPVTKLWEFYDLRSAWDGVADPASLAIPAHEPDGRIAVGKDTGIVFVLLPGGTASIGSQSQDANAPNHDPDALWWTGPVHEVQLDPFLLARHEVTAAQWERLCTGTDAERHPNGYAPGFDDFAGHVVTWWNPVEKLGWREADGTLREHGMTLPTEAQWEYACRADTTTPYWTGATTATLKGVANVHDAAGAKSNPQLGKAAPFDDGYVIHAPVGTFAPNPFGLFDVHGNVAEWSRDRTCTNRGGFRDGDGARTQSDTKDDFSFRGGSFVNQAAQTRCGLWGYASPEFRTPDLGARAARLLRRP